MEFKEQIKSYKDLLIWQKGISICKLVSSFPSDEKYGLTTQMKRSSISIILSNIAEEYGRNYTNSYVHFLSIARGSLMELETQIILAYELGFLEKSNLLEINNLIEEECKMLNSLIKTIKSNA